MRITQSMVMNSYVNRLGKIFANSDRASQQVITHGRKFLTSSEDPASTARAYQLRKNFQMNNDFLNNVNDVLDTMDTIDARLMVLSDIATKAHTTLTAGRNGPWAVEDRTIFANELLSMQASAVDALNAKFDDKFLFGGSSTKTLPFTLTGSPPHQVLRFRGIDVTSRDPMDQARLQEFANEKIYVDMGFGLTVNTVDGAPSVLDNSAFNIAIPGLNFVGHGINPADNFILNMGLIANELMQEPLDYERTTVLWEKLTDQRLNIIGSVTKVGADYNFLLRQRGVLEVSNDNLNNKILNVEFMEMEEAIMNMKMADYI